MGIGFLPLLEPAGASRDLLMPSHKKSCSLGQDFSIFCRLVKQTDLIFDFVENEW
jgi:hypothetical protein